MALFDDAGLIPAAQISRPNQKDSTGSIEALVLAEYGGQVEGTIERRSIMNGWVPMKSVRGTNTVTNYAVGEATLQKLVVGTPPDGSPTDLGSNSVKVDTVVLARTIVPLLEEFQSKIDVRMEMGTEHGKKIAKFFDESFLIQGAKAATSTNSAFSSTAGKPAGHYGGTVKTLADTASSKDPAKLYSAIRNLFTDMEAKDVSPRDDDIALFFRPEQFYALQDAEQIVNGNYITSAGNRLNDVAIFKAFGVPVFSTNNLPKTNITGHFLSNAGNSNAYDGDFTKLVGLAMSAKALLAGETIPLQHKVWFNDEYKVHFVDSWLSYGVTKNRCEYAGALYIA
ncbi:major capsid protein [Caulobacter phage Percy]|uniref:Major capsid protein n=1 Tax=Caulobacter phage Percy TaxID=1701809 RepID=A0A0M3UL67_9CAUD|nr:major head protein [Caulobacter phage Percy]ALF01673.1 major capsid protein [Caulobacter phage Percy]